MKLHFVDTMDEVLALALESPLPAPITTDMPAETDVLASVQNTETAGNRPAQQ